MPAAIGARRRGIGTKPKWGVDGQQYEYAALLQGRDKKFSRGWFWSLGIGGMIFNAPHLMAAFGITITETDVLDWRNDVLWTWLAAVRAKEFGCRPPLPAALVDRRIRACFVVIDSAGQSWRMSISRMSLASDRRSPELASGLPTFCLYLK